MTRLEQEREASTLRPAAPIRSMLFEHYRSLLMAVQFLTRLPTPRVDLGDEAETRLILGRSAAYFPLVGALIGTMTGATILLAGRLWPIGLSVAIGLAFEAVMTGAFHEDAVADFCDAFGGGWTRDDILRILKDSRIGAYGALGLGLAVVMRGSAIASLETDRLHRCRVGVGHNRTLGDPAGNVGPSPDCRSREPQPRRRPANRPETAGAGDRVGNPRLPRFCSHQPRSSGRCRRGGPHAHRVACPLRRPQARGNERR
jgi:Cobalamin-5-phosphate synthase